MNNDICIKKYIPDLLYVKLTEQGARERVLRGQVGATYEVHDVTPSPDRTYANVHVIDYTTPNNPHNPYHLYQTWTLSKGDYELCNPEDQVVIDRLIENWPERFTFGYYSGWY